MKSVVIKMEYTITKQISKQGNQTMILIPAFLKDKLKPKSLVEVKIKILEDNQNE
jgi:antitoxin component of MazEF toxin-antitoxin module